MYFKEKRQRIRPTRKFDAPKWLKHQNVTLSLPFNFICLRLLFLKVALPTPHILNVSLDFTIENKENWTRALDTFFCIFFFNLTILTSSKF